ncbi:MAG: hypothetical protein H7338_05095 [Candidatus Sericytochromatia bacterium]|nr:hypothetical protein [Candidatus Sericytochromatia bacterium]
MIGLCYWRQAIRVVRVDRIKTVTVTATPYVVPAGIRLRGRSKRPR